MTLLWLALAILLNAAANILIKLQAESTSGRAAPLIGVYFALGVGCFALALLAYRVVLARLPLTVAYPIMTIVGLMLITGFSAVYLAESISAGRLLGMVLGAVAIIFIVRG